MSSACVLHAFFRFVLNVSIFFTQSTSFCKSILIIEIILISNCFGIRCILLLFIMIVTMIQVISIIITFIFIYFFIIIVIIIIVTIIMMMVTIIDKIIHMHANAHQYDDFYRTKVLLECNYMRDGGKHSSEQITQLVNDDTDAWNDDEWQADITYIYYMVRHGRARQGRQRQLHHRAESGTVSAPNACHIREGNFQ